MKLSTDAKGVFPIAPTPFHDDGAIDNSSIDKLIDFYLGCGATGVTVLVNSVRRPSWNMPNRWRSPRR